MGRTKPGSLVINRPDGSEEQVVLNADVTTCGRSDTCMVVIPMPTVSRLHATIELQHGRYVLIDHGSANGTFVNGQRITEPHQLSTSDMIWLGSEDVVLIFADPEETMAVPRYRAPAALEIDDKAHLVRVHGVPCELSPLEYSLLVYLARNPGTVCTRDACFLAVWGRTYDHSTCEDALNACVAKLRRNLRAAADVTGSSAPSVATIPRVGFRLDDEVAFTSLPREYSVQSRSVGA